ncbi:hypothetical protein [Natronococcus wangiae]|uniref:hypothetical protein n=1 Tax=Natronococcus wangiae TaxID=3068275 RepID=UPI00273F3D0E|nr:hypothetical protein [Natronococcus sp. AD5]
MTPHPNVALPVGLAVGDLGTPAFLALFGLLAFLILAARADHALETFGGDDSAGRSKTNCPACGGRIAVESDSCDHCEHSPAGDETPGYGWAET